MTLEDWVKNWRPTEVKVQGDLRGISDTERIAHGRTWLFGLSDYHVTTVVERVIWLAPGASVAALILEAGRWRTTAGRIEC